MAKIIQIVGMAAAIILPLWNIPLIIRIERRKSSGDISLLWALGVFVCLLLMLPAAVVSTDVVFKSFSIVNIVLFTGVVVQVARYHR